LSARISHWRARPHFVDADDREIEYYPSNDIADDVKDYNMKSLVPE
jgi:hypothetical protein